MSRRRLIINADDFGLAPGVDHGIVEGWRDGVLTSTTMLVNLPGFAHAVDLAREHPDLPVGIHLSLLWGPPVAPPESVPTLLTGDGLFPRSAAVLARRAALGRVDPADVRRELTAQIRKFHDAGLVPTHVDTHKHVHCLPLVMTALADVLVEAGIEKVRLPIERARAGGPRPATKNAWKRRAIARLCRGHRRLLDARRLRTTDHFTGLAHADWHRPDVLAHLLRTQEEGITELMCHPGRPDPQADRWSKRPPDRTGELQGLLAETTEREIRAQEIDLISYRDL